MTPSSTGISALFDLDGVIVDTEPSYTRFWHTTGQKYNLSPTFATDIKGTTLNDILNRHFPRTLHDQVKHEIWQYEETMEYVLFPGAIELLRSLRKAGIPTAIVTSSDNTKMSYLYRQHPELTELVDTIITGDLVTKSKPDPQGYLLAASRLGCDPTRSFVVEDTLQGLKAGKAAGATTIGIATTLPPEVIAPFSDHLVPSIADIPLQFFAPSESKK